MSQNNNYISVIILSLLIYLFLTADGGTPFLVFDLDCYASKVASTDSYKQYESNNKGVYIFYLLTYIQFHLQVVGDVETRNTHHVPLHHQIAHNKDIHL